MSAQFTILALVFYPLLSNIPFNVVGFRWGLSHRPSPMPPEVREKAETADRLVQLVIYAILLTFVVLLLRDSAISTHAVGITIDKWKSAAALGVLLSCVPLALSTILLRILPPSEIQEQPESHDPLAAWCGLAALGSISVELWRAICIVSLVRLDLSAWLAVALVSVAFGAAQLPTSTARAAGAAIYACIPGFLFVYTGSLVAPVTLSLVAQAGRLYQVRHASRRVVAHLIALERPIGSQIGEKAQILGRVDVTCPTCTASFNPAKVEKTIRTFKCPECGEVLEYETGRFDYFLFFFCLYCVPVLAYFLGFRDLSLILLSIGGAAVFFFLGVAVHSFFVAPKAQLHLKYGDTGLHLTGRRSRAGSTPPKADKKLQE